MRKLVISSLLLLSFVPIIFADDLRKRAEENPLDCAVYLAIAEGGNDDDIIEALMSAGRYDEALRFVERPDIRMDDLITYASFLLEKGKRTEAEGVLNLAMLHTRKAGDEWSPYYVGDLPRMLTAAGLEKEALELLDNQEDDEDRVKVLLDMVDGFKKAGQTEKSLVYLKLAWDLQKPTADPDDMVHLARLFGVFNDKERLRDVLVLFEERNSTNTADNRSKLYLEAAALYLQLSEPEKAMRIWREHQDIDRPYDNYLFISALIRTGYSGMAEPLLLQLLSDKDFLEKDGGSKLVSLYLIRGELQAARTIAISISEKNDSYWQQDALMRVVDKMIEAGNREEAGKLLDIAYNKARRVGEEHSGRDSVGASPLSRKTIYLNQIRNRYFKLGFYSKGLATPSAIKIVNDYSQSFGAETLLEYAELRRNALSRKEFDRTIKSAMDLFKDDDGYRRESTLARAAQLYAMAGDKGNALAIVNMMLEEALEDSSESRNLFPIGKLFEETKLKADAKTRSLLKQIIKKEIGGE